MATLSEAVQRFLQVLDHIEGKDRQPTVFEHLFLRSAYRFLVSDPPLAIMVLEGMEHASRPGSQQPVRVKTIEEWRSEVRKLAH